MQDFTKGNVLRQVIGFSIPLILANLLMTCYGIINMIWVGRLLGHEAVAGIASAMPVLMLFPSFLIGLGMATSILIAQAYGQKNEPLMKRVLANSFMAIFVLCVILSIAGTLMRRMVLHWVHTPPEVLEMAASYLGVLVGSMLLQFYFNWLSGMLRSLGDATTPLIIILAATLLNIILVPLFITGAGPLPRLGLTGAAWGTVLANFLAGLGGYFYVEKKYPLFNIRRWEFTVDWAIIKRVFGIGIPASLQMIVASVSGIFIISLVNRFGTEVAAAYGIGIQVDTVAFFPAMTIGFAVTSMVGQNLGAGKMGRVHEIMNKSLLVSVAISLVFACGVILFPRQIGTLFLSSTDHREAVLGHLQHYYRYIGFTYVIFAALFAIQGVVRGSGDTMPLMVLAVISFILVRIPLAHVLARRTGLGESGIWAAILISTAIAIMISYGYYKSGRWERVKVLQRIGG
jgi:putative MATE family efflux protein